MSFKCLCCNAKVRQRDRVRVGPYNVYEIMEVLRDVGWTPATLRLEPERVEFQAEGLLAMLDSGAAVWPEIPRVTH